MLFMPKARNSTALLERTKLRADMQSRARYGPAALGKSALYVSGLSLPRWGYLPLSAVQRVFKRVAETAGGVYGRLAYLVVVSGGEETRCLFREEGQLDALLSALQTEHPEIPVGKNK